MDTNELIQSIYLERLPQGLNMEIEEMSSLPPRTDCVDVEGFARFARELGERRPAYSESMRQGAL